MNIGLKTDAPMANIALMKISSYYKKKGDIVQWVDPLIHYDIIYYSKIFNFDTNETKLSADRIIKGGTGFDVITKLAEDIENIKDVDYSIYPKCNYSIQFFSRGCFRNCSFCLVRQKEGYIHPVEPVDLNPRGKIIEVLDNNFFGNPEWKTAIKYLQEKNQKVNFHGVDIRIITEEQCEALNTLRHYKQVHIAWDNVNDKTVPENIKIMLKYFKAYKLMCYVLIGYNSTPEEDLYRVETLRSLKIDPFVMAYNKNDLYQKRFARWVNHKAIFKTVKWGDYGKKINKLNNKQLF